MSAYRLAIAAVTVSGAAALAVGPACAVPRYSARYEQKCALCHVNPSGGGMRTPYATQQLVPEEIAWSPTRPETLERIDPRIGKQLLIGTDFRELYVRSEVPERRLNFFQMQADLYVGFQLDPKVTLYYDRGQRDSHEIFGLVYLLPTFYLKAGRFVPSCGWNFDDHTMFVRSELGLQPPGNSDVGVEVGYSWRSLDVQVDLVNGNRGSTLDNDTATSQLLNAVYRFHAGPVGAGVGASGYRNPTREGYLNSGGLYGYLTFKRLTWLAEADLVDTRDGTGSTRDGVAVSHEWTWQLHQGLDLKATLDFFDPDRHLETGSKTRWGAGVYAMPRSYATLELLVRRTTFDNGIAYAGTDFTETVAQLHLLY